MKGILALPTAMLEHAERDNLRVGQMVQVTIQGVVTKEFTEQLGDDDPREIGPPRMAISVEHVVEWA